MKLLWRLSLCASLIVLASILLIPRHTLAGIIQAIIPAAVPTSFQNPPGGVKFQLTDSSGNISTAGSITSGAGSGVGGVLDLTEGTAPTFSAPNTFSLYAPTSIPASYQWRVPTADGLGCIQSNGAGVLSIGACGSGTGTPGSTLFSSTTSTGPSNSAVETTLIGTVTGSTTIAANTFTGGAILEARGQGFFSLPGTADSLTLKAKCGSTVLGSASFTPAAGVVTNGSFRFWLMISARGSGAGGAFMTNGLVEMSGSALTGTVSKVLNTSNVAFDFTTACVFDMTAQWGAGQVGESITGTNVAAWIPGAPVSSVQGLTGAVTITDANLSVSNVITNNASTSAHGFVPILPNDATKFYNGVGGFTVPPGSSCFPQFSGTITSPVIADWTTNGVGGTRTDTSGPCGNAINIVGTTGGTGNLFGITHAVAAGDFTHFLVLYGNIIRGANSTVAAGFTNGTAVESCGMIWIAGGEAQLNTTRVTALSGGVYSAATGQSFANDIQPAANLIVVRLTRTGANLACAISFDVGITYTPFFNDTGATIAASAVGVWTDPRGASDPSRLTLISYQ